MLVWAMARDILTDQQWERLRVLLPPQKPKTGRPAKDHRVVIDGILWILRTGAPWRDLPSSMALGKPSLPASTVGSKQASGLACLRNCSGRRMATATWTGACTTSMEL